MYVRGQLASRWWRGYLRWNWRGSVNSNFATECVGLSSMETQQRPIIPVAISAPDAVTVASIMSSHKGRPRAPQDRPGSFMCGGDHARHVLRYVRVTSKACVCLGVGVYVCGLCGGVCVRGAARFLVRTVCPMRAVAVKL